MSNTAPLAWDSAPRPGVFSSEMLRSAVASGLIVAPKSDPIEDAQYQPASLDLRLGSTAYRLRSSFLPGAGSTVQQRLGDLQMGPALKLDDPAGVVLERGRPYLIPLVERLDLPAHIRGRTNPRSSTGRLDIFTRVITDNGAQFDEIRPGYSGRLWLEVYSTSFTVSVRRGLALAQLRLSEGDQSLSTTEVRALHDEGGLIYEDVGQQRRRVEEPSISGGGLFLSVHLPQNGLVGWQARRDSPLLDLMVENKYAPLDFWEPVTAERGGRLVLHPEHFYLLISREYAVIPPGVASEMVAYDPTSGELRTHYAGFFDPGFGVKPPGALSGTRAVLEVRAHDVPFMLEDAQPVARLAYERMAAEPQRLYGQSAAGSHFQNQGVALSRQFGPVEFRTSFPTMS
ncbi:MAG: 2'-deoxycytidine 5'-triphosphate deaminase [Chloroflexi bacterium]|nr:2'-deoxycytidine 5'-triphosphate deaminase [Chloroflexota bacterium]MDA1145788.1 2'-deoxycytidine 5'-triphosphate deaminase [Chloroflexota bacterium]